MIPLMNLTRQYESIQEKLDAAALKVLHSGQYIMGDEVIDFEKEFAAYIGVKYAVGVGNGTDALTIALKAVGVTAGDEVITSAMSFFATAEAIATIGAIPVFVDCTPDTHLLDAAKIEEKITNRTRAVLPIHLYGQCADMDTVCEIARRYGLKVIEDAAQASGAEYKGAKAGSLGDVACFSFFPTKNLGGAGDGGIITTDDENIYRMCMAYRVHGSGENGFFAYGQEQHMQVDISTQDFHGNLPKYYNYVIGKNSRLDALQAAILRTKLPYLESWNKVRREIADKYFSGIKNPAVELPVCRVDSNPIFYVYVVLVKNRAKFREHLKENGIATGVYFPVPLHLQKVFEQYGYQEGDMPNAEYLANHGVAIPMFPELTEQEIDKVIEIINNYED